MTKSLADWTSDREVAAPGPSTDPEQLREAYLGLLKLALCDLAGHTTISVGRLEDDQIFSRELPADQLALRTNGMDWPLSGLTMAGMLRLDDLQRCIESVVADGIAGDLVEAGSWRGGASILARATLDSLGATDRRLFVADSFQGFPRPDAERYPADGANDLEMFEFLSAPLDEVKASFHRFGLDDGVEFVPGFFDATMPGLSGHPWAIARLDGDTYEATWLTLEALYPSLAVGGYLIVDDYGAFDECRAAVDEFRARHGIEEPIERVDWTCVKWRRESDRAIEVDLPEPAEAGAPPPPARTSDKRTTRELVSVRELALQGRLDEAEAELRKLQGSRAVVLAARLRNLARRGRPKR